MEKKADPKMNIVFTLETSVQSMSGDPGELIRKLSTALEGFQKALDGIAEQGNYSSGSMGSNAVPAGVKGIETAEESADEGIPEDKTPPFHMESKETEDPGDIQPDAGTEDSDTSGRTAITKDMLTRVVVSKIKQDRANSDRISHLVKAYGVNQLSDLPEDQYEAFLNDLSEL